MNDDGRFANRLRRMVMRSRPRFWLYLSGPVLVGLAHGADGASDLRSLPSIALLAYFLVPANVFLYGVNDVFDADVDRENPKKGGREVRYRGDPLTVGAVALSGVLGISLALWLPAAAPWILGFLLLGYVYSAPPRLKTTPPLDSVSNGLYILPGVAAYALLAGTLPPIPILIGAWFWTMGMHTFSAVPDVAPDRRAGIRTMATVLGERLALVYCGACWLLAAVAFAVIDPRGGGLLLVYPAVVVAVHSADVSIDRAYWWFPAINGLVGMMLTLGGLWGLIDA